MLQNHQIMLSQAKLEAQVRLKEVRYLQHNPKVSSSILVGEWSKQIISKLFSCQIIEKYLSNIIRYLGAVSEDRKGAKLPEDDSEAAEASRKDREARSIAIEKVNMLNL